MGDSNPTKDVQYSFTETSKSRDHNLILAKLMSFRWYYPDQVLTVRSQNEAFVKPRTPVNRAAMPSENHRYPWSPKNDQMTKKWQTATMLSIKTISQSNFPQGVARKLKRAPKAREA